MAALDFPNSPTTGQIFTAPSGAQWQWDGAKWAPYGTVSSAYVLKAGDTMTGNLTLAPASGAADLIITASSGQHALIQLMKAAAGANTYLVSYTAGQPRWTIIMGDNVAESGGNAGSNFEIQRYSDAGALIDNPISIPRSTGIVSLSQPLPLASGGTGNSYVPGEGLSLVAQAGSIGGWEFPGLATNGRLTLSSGVAVMGSNNYAAATTIYFTPYLGTRQSYFNGAQSHSVYFNEISFALTAGAHLANSNYDIFLYLNAGSVILVTGPAWTNATTRSLAVGQVGLGWPANNAAFTGTLSGGGTVAVPQYQATYLGTFRTTAAGTTTWNPNPAPASGGGHPQLFLWNFFNRRFQQAFNQDNGASYTYATNTPRQARGSANNQIDYVCGFAEDTMVIARSSTLTASSGGQCGIGVDSTTAYWRGGGINAPSAFASLATGTFYAFNSGVVDMAVGLHYVAMLENGSATSGNFDAAGNDFLSIAGFF